MESFTAAQQWQMFWCSFYGTGIILMLAIYGVLQERIMTEKYDGAQFGDSAFLVFCNRAVAVVFGLALCVFRREPMALQAPAWKYAVVSFSNVLASTCQYEALKWVSFPVQMLGKSFKMLPVMLWGVVISQKGYGRRDWIIAALVTGGVTEFLLTGPIVDEDESNGDSSKVYYGLLLLCAFLACDGLTSTMQEKLFKEYAVSRYNQILWVNTFSSAVSIGILAVGGQVVAALTFCRDHPAFVANALELSVASVSSQWFIYGLIEGFGALAFAATMNIRQVVSTVISYIQYGHSITVLQVCGLGCVFGALFYKSYVGLVEDKKKGEKEPLVPKAATGEVQDDINKKSQV